jgi:all-trans-retinol dehydrogenase (NAD+)
VSDFSGKNVLITGAASGIGRLLAQQIARMKGRLVLWDVNKEGLDALGEELRQHGAKVSTYFCDLSDRNSINSAAESVRDDHGHIDILINNAGIVSGSPLLEISDEDILRTFDVNTLALFWTTRAFLPGMIDRGSGHIVTIASAAGVVGTSRLTDYSASKFAAVGFDESLRLELKRLNIPIQTTVVCPFYIDTGMFAGVRTRFSWILPILKPEYVANKIVKAIHRNRRRLIMPRAVATVFPARLLPVRIFDALLAFLGVSKTMDEFTGRSG